MVVVELDHRRTDRLQFVRLDAVRHCFSYEVHELHRAVEIIHFTGAQIEALPPVEGQRLLRRGEEL